MINNTTKFLIVGLGLLGGSYAKALKQKEYYVSALDINPDSIDFALKNPELKDKTEEYINSIKK